MLAGNTLGGAEDGTQVLPPLTRGDGWLWSNAACEEEEEMLCRWAYLLYASEAGDWLPSGV